MAEKLLQNLTVSFYLAVFVAAMASFTAYLGDSDMATAIPFGVAVAAGFLAIDYAIARRLVGLTLLNAEILDLADQNQGGDYDL